jgi:hypothetical protein
MEKDLDVAVRTTAPSESYQIPLSQLRHQPCDRVSLDATDVVSQRLTLDV